MDSFFYIYTFLILALNCWLWYGFTRYILSVITGVQMNIDYTGVDSLKGLLLARLYDIFLDLKNWRPSKRIEAINMRARSYGNSEDR